METNYSHLVISHIALERIHSFPHMEPESLTCLGRFMGNGKRFDLDRMEQQSQMLKMGGDGGGGGGGTPDPD